MQIGQNMRTIEDVYNGKVDPGSVDIAWLHDGSPSTFHMFFGDQGCGCFPECLPPMEYMIWDGAGLWLKAQPLAFVKYGGLRNDNE